MVPGAVLTGVLAGAAVELLGVGGVGPLTAGQKAAAGGVRFP